MYGSRLQPGEFTPKKKSGHQRRMPKAPKGKKRDKRLAQERRKGRDTLRRKFFRDQNVAKSADPTAPSPNQADEEKIEREQWEEEYERDLTFMLEQRRIWDEEEEEEKRRQDEKEEEMRRRDEECILSKDDSAGGHESWEDPGYGCCHKSCREWRHVTGGHCLNHI